LSILRRVNQLPLDKLPARANLRPKEVAAYLNVSTTLIYDLIRSGDLPAVKLGRHYRISRDGLVKAMQTSLVVQPEF
jgi:excisionase family DNA binding protein